MEQRQPWIHRHSRITATIIATNTALVIFYVVFPIIMTFLSRW